MTLDIETLMVDEGDLETNKAFQDSIAGLPAHSGLVTYAICRFQLVKALWGIVDWLANETHRPDRESMHRDQDRLRARQLSDGLVKIGMERP